MSQLILQPFHYFTYITTHSPTLLSLLLRHRIFHLRHLVSLPWLEINIKMSSVWFKFPPVLKMAKYSMPRETYLYLATLDSSDSNSAQMRRIWVAGIHKLADTVSVPPRHPKPRTLCSLWCIIAVYNSLSTYLGSLWSSELELKVICVIGNSTIFLLVASFVMEKR